MGRHAGWLTAAAALARKHDDDGPHLVYVPERQFSIDQYLGDIDRVYKQHGRCIVALSEGVWATRNDKGKEVPLAADLMSKAGREPQVDDHGNIQLSGGALADELARLKRTHGHAVLWDGHSIRSQLPWLFDGKLPDLNLGTASGTSCDATLRSALMAVLAG